jgi:hypothetical protein
MPSATPDPDKVRRGIIVTFIVGPLFIALSVWALLTGGSGEVTCGGTTMSPGDTCETMLYGVIPTGARSYDTERTIDHLAPWVMAGVGILAVANAGRRLVRLRRENAELASK